MSYNSWFETSPDDDIVTLQPAPGDSGCAGWINVGVHAIRVKLDAEGNLTVQTYARTEEGRELAEARVSKETAVEAGGIDPDQSEDEEADEESGKDGSTPC